jgi:phosphoribosylglycinamide formyltransferase 1
VEKNPQARTTLFRESMKIGIMLSGTGSTYAAIAKAIDDGRIPKAQIVRVISSKAQAGGLKIAEQYGHPVTVISTQSPEHHQQISDAFIHAGVDLIVMAGYMNLWQLDHRLEGKVINIHPSLIPAFCGKGMYGHHVHEAVIAKGVRFSGCTVHLVDREYDHGQILEQRVVSVESNESAESLATKIGITEKSLLINVIANWKNYCP